MPDRDNPPCTGHEWLSMFANDRSVIPYAVKCSNCGEERCEPDCKSDRCPFLVRWINRGMPKGTDYLSRPAHGAATEAPGSASVADSRAGEWKLVPGDLWRRVVAYIGGSRVDGSIALAQAIEEYEARNGR